MVGRAAARAGEEEDAMGERGKVTADEEEEEEGAEGDDDEVDADCCKCDVGYLRERRH